MARVGLFDMHARVSAIEARLRELTRLCETSKPLPSLINAVDMGNVLKEVQETSFPGAKRMAQGELRSVDCEANLNAFKSGTQVPTNSKESTS